MAELRRLLKQVPRGHVTSFGDLAEALGDLQAARWVAKELQELDLTELPIHRVVKRTGKIPETHHLPTQRRCALLQKEGVVVKGQVVDVEKFGWWDFSGPQPLIRLRNLQMALAGRLELTALESLPQRLAGLDVSYRTERLAAAAYAVVDLATKSLVDHEILVAEVPFPYIPGYLSFRELPLYHQLFERLRESGRLEPWILVDGNGILHPRRAGIASLVGLALSVHTVGVSKHLLCGKVSMGSSAAAPVLAEDGTTLGFRLQRGSKRSTLYVSPGTGVDCDGARQIVEASFLGHRFPEPIFHADRLSREAARKL